MDVPFWSLVPCITLDKQEREALMPWPRFFASSAGYLTGVLSLPLVHWLGAGNEGEGFMRFTFILVFFFILSTLVILRNVKERYSSSHSTQQVAHRLRDVLTLIYRNKPLFALLIMALSWNLAHNIITSFAIYYFKYVVGRADLFPWYMMFAGVANLLAIVLFPRLARRFSRRKLWIAASLLPVLSCFLLLGVALFAPPTGRLRSAACRILLSLAAQHNRLLSACAARPDGASLPGALPPDRALLRCGAAVSRINIPFCRLPHSARD
ncbi:MAG: MFS transporter [Pantoea sp.]|nr:MFS transporter [Pantoea sp.]